MNNTEQLVEEFVEKINSLHETVSVRNWREMPREIFVEALGESVKELRGLKEKTEKIIKETAGEEDAPDLNELLREFSKEMPFLERNLALEKGRKPSEKINIKDRAEMPELYGSVEQKIITLLLRCRYSAERMIIFIRKKKGRPIEGKSAARDILKLLGKKEEELQSLKKKYDIVRKKSYLGTVEEETSSDREQELFEASRLMEKASTELNTEMKGQKKEIEAVQYAYKQLESKLGEQRETFDRFAAKSFEIITLLKKERDYAKKIVLDVEHETLQLRTAYSREIINMQEEKSNAKKEAEEKYERRLLALKEEVKKSEDLMQHFRTMAEGKSKELDEVKEKLTTARLLLSVKKKHNAVKKAFAGKEKKKKKGKKKSAKKTKRKKMTKITTAG